MSYEQETYCNQCTRTGLVDESGACADCVYYEGLSKLSLTELVEHDALDSLAAHATEKMRQFVEAHYDEFVDFFASGGRNSEDDVEEEFDGEPSEESVEDLETENEQ